MITSTVINEVLDDLFQVHHLGPPFDKCQVDDAKGVLHLRVLVQLVQHNTGHCAPLQHDHDAHAFAVRLVTDIGYVRNLFCLDQECDFSIRLPCLPDREFP
jgi:hypothetical protein